MPSIESFVDTLGRSFSDRTLARGIDYAQRGFVHLEKSRALPWVAVVRGSRLQPYNVQVLLSEETGIYSSYCSCPAEINCKHGAATALVAFEGLMEGGEDAEAGEPPRKQDTEDEAARWLNQVASLRNAEEQRMSNRLLAFVLRSDDSRVVVEILETRALKRGGFGRPKGLPAQTIPGNWPLWMARDDKRLFALINAESERLGYGFYYDTEMLSAYVLESLAETGRLFWEHVHAPLRYDDALSQTLRWKEVDSGHVVLSLDDDIRLIPALGPHYVHVKRSTIGPLNIGNAQTALPNLIDPPLVPKSMVPTMERSLAKFDLNIEPLAKKTPKALPLEPRALFRFRGFKRYKNPIELDCEALYGTHRFELGQWEHDPRPKSQVVRDLVLESERLRKIRQLIASSMPLDGLVRSSEDHQRIGVALADEVIPRLRADGWSVEINESSLPTPLPEHPSDWVEEWSEAEGGDSWFCELGVVLNGKKLSLLPILLQALKKGHISLEALQDSEKPLDPLVFALSKDEKIVIPGERLRLWLAPLVELMLRGLNAEERFEMPSITAAYVAESTVNLDHRSLAQMRERVKTLIGMSPETECESFQGTLRDYQREGLAWLSAVLKLGLGGLLCDDMGLGKTVQVLALLEKMRVQKQISATNPVLILAPRSVVGNWKREAKTFAPKLMTRLHLGSQRADSKADLLTSDVIITSYQTMLRDKKLFGSIKWEAAFFDEAQAIKNPKTKLRRAVADLPAKTKFCITGTPIENNLSELWSQVDVAVPGLLGNTRAFQQVFRTPIEKYENQEQLELLKSRIKPFLVRRTKSQVAIELPDKTEIVSMVQFDDAQRDLYESLRLALESKIRDALVDKGIGGSSIVILDALLKLRQCCCDPRLVKNDRAKGVGSSAKLEQLMSMLTELANAGRSVLVFSQFTSMLKLIEAECESAQIPTLKLTGQTQKRDELVERFQGGEAPVFLISLKAGGTGLNLTQADTVIHYDPWWNPAVEDQATDRAHRIGQDKNVTVYRLVAEGTLEEHIMRMQKSKRGLSDAMLEKGGVSQLTQDDLNALFSPII